MLLFAREFFTKAFGHTLGLIICGILPFVAYVLFYRLLAVFAPFKIDLVIYAAAAMIFHFGLATYLSVRKIND